MKEAGIRDNQYITIMGWMRNMQEIETNNELMAYALIYGFSQTEGQYLTCRQSYIASWLKITRMNCNRLLARMEQKGLIKRKVAKKNGIIKTYKYSCILPNETSAVTIHDECRNSTRDECRNDTRSECRNSTHDNNIYNNILYMSAEKTKNSTHNPKNKNQFMNFEQRDYNFEQLEMELACNLSAPEREES